MSESILKKIKQLENQNIKFKKLLDATLEFTGQENTKLVQLQNESELLKKTVTDLENQKRQLEEELFEIAGNVYPNEAVLNEKLENKTLDIKGKLEHVVEDIKKETSEIVQFKNEDANLKQALHNFKQEKQQVLEEIRLIKEANEINEEIAEKHARLQQEIANLDKAQIAQPIMSTTSREIVAKLASLENLRQLYEAQINDSQSSNALDVPVENTVLELKISSIVRKKDNLLNELRTVLLTSAEEISKLHSSTQDGQLRHMLNELDVHKSVLMVNMINIKQSSMALLEKFEKEQKKVSKEEEMGEVLTENTENENLKERVYVVSNFQEQINVALNFEKNKLINFPDSGLNEATVQEVEKTKSNSQENNLKETVNAQYLKDNIYEEATSDDNIYKTISETTVPNLLMLTKEIEEIQSKEFVNELNTTKQFTTNQNLTSQQDVERKGLTSEIADKLAVIKIPDYLRMGYENLNLNPDTLSKDGKAYLHLTLEFIKNLKEEEHNKLDNLTPYPGLSGSIENNITEEELADGQYKSDKKISKNACQKTIYSKESLSKLLSHQPQNNEILSECSAATESKEKLLKLNQNEDPTRKISKELLNQIMEIPNPTEKISIPNVPKTTETHSECSMEKESEEELTNIDQDHFDVLSTVEEEDYNPFDLIAEHKKLMQLKNIEKVQQINEDQEALADLQKEHNRLIIEVSRLEQERQQLLDQLTVLQISDDINNNSDLGDAFVTEESSVNLPLPMDDATNQMYPTDEQLLGQRIRELEMDNQRIKNELKLILEQIQADKNEMEILQQAENLLRDRINDLQITQDKEDFDFE